MSLVPFDKIWIMQGAERTAKGKDVDGFEEIGFAFAVLAYKDGEGLC